MLFGDPPPTAWDWNFRIWGIPVRVHPWFWLIAVFLIINLLSSVATVQRLLSLALPWMVAVFVGVLVHELGHALAMRAFGRSPRITLYGFGGFTSSDLDRLYSARGFSTLGQVLISLAGPAAGFVLAALVVILCLVTGHDVVIRFGGLYGIFIGVAPLGAMWLSWFIESLLIISVFWGLMNLLPIYPLDGGQVARELLVHYDRRQGIRWSLILSMVTAGLVAAVAALLWRDPFVAIFFGFLAYQSYAALRAYGSAR